MLHPLDSQTFAVASVPVFSVSLSILGHIMLNIGQRFSLISTGDSDLPSLHSAVPMVRCNSSFPEKLCPMRTIEYILSIVGHVILNT